VPSLPFARSFRARLLLVILLVSLVPIGVVGVWLVRRASRTGEDLLRARIVDALDFTGRGISGRWIQGRSRLLDLAADTNVRQVAARALSPADADGPFGSMGAGFASLTLRDAAGQSVATRTAALRPGEVATPGLVMTVPVHASTLGPVVGSIDAVVPVSSLLVPERSRPGSIGAIVGVYGAEGRAPLAPLPFDPSGDGDRLQWGGDEWLLVDRPMGDIPVRLVGAAPLSPFRTPAADAARAGLWILLLVSATGIGLAMLMTTQLTRSLERLARAADAVAGGGLERQVEAAGADEVARVGRAFNHMTASLRTTTQQLAEQRALARVGEFAASIAHEVRNPLTAVRLDLQVAREAIPDDSRAARPLGRALAGIDRLDRTVSTALLATRAARVDGTRVDLMRPLRAACDAAARSSARPLEIAIDGPDRLEVPGDAAALEQVFLNVLLNAVEAVRGGGQVRAVVRADESSVTVRIEDTGVGIAPDVARNAFEPFFTTREAGTGLGLTIASRLMRAHDGRLELSGTPGAGTTALITLPRPSGASPST